MDESLNSVGPDDFDFPWCMAEHGAVFQAVAECLYLYRDHRDSYRLTTHLPLNVHVREIRRIMMKHGASASQIRARVAAARRSYLRQCLFRSETRAPAQAVVGIRRPGQLAGDVSLAIRLSAAPSPEDRRYIASQRASRSPR